MSEHNRRSLRRIFTAKAEAASCVVREAASMDQVLDYALGLCPPGKAVSLAAPNLSPRDFAALAARCVDKGFACLDRGLRDHGEGIGIGLALCLGGIADTGTVVLACAGEETRLASMLAEVFVAVVPAGALHPDLFAARETLERAMGADPSYTAFITGPSRTADIERVLALGAHGPLEMHVLILDEQGANAPQGS